MQQTEIEIDTMKKEGQPLRAERNSSIELYRIITMLLIVAHHYVVNSGLAAADGPIYASPLSFHSVFLLELGAWGKTGINCFVLITGYFMCESHISAKKFSKLLLERTFYKIVIYCIFWVSGYAVFNLSGLAEILLPVRTIGTGFTSAYLLFFLFIPFLNVLVHNLTEKQHVYLLLLCGFIYVFLGTFRPVFSVTMNYVSWFIVLYVISSYIRLYPKQIFNNTTVWGWLTVISMSLSFISVIVCAWLGQRIGKNMAYAFVTDANTLLAIINGVSSFLLFKNLKIKQNKWINRIAASTFGVLCIHANSDTMRQWLWKDTFDCVGHYTQPFYAVGAVILIFAVCTVIDMLRIRYIETPFFSLWDAKWGKVVKWYQKKEYKIMRKMDIQND